MQICPNRGSLPTNPINLTNPINPKMSMTLIKICGITNVEDALESVRLGAHMLGFVFAESPREVGVDTVRSIQRILAGDVKTVGVFTQESDEVLSIMDSCQLTYAQLHGGQSEDFARRVGAERVIRVARVSDKPSLEGLSRFAQAKYYLLDTYKKGIAGGTGETFDWDLLTQADPAGKPIILSGGLNSANVGEAVRKLRPFAVDVSSGVELCPGKKDHDKLKEFIDNVREADDAS